MTRRLRTSAAALLVAAHAAAAQPGLFTDAGDLSGLDFVHWNGMSGELYFVEMMGPGGAFFDYDGDGDLDVYVVQGHMLGGKPASAALFPAPGPTPLDRLYRNDLVPSEDGPLPRFVDVTAASGIRAPGYGMGAAVGDFDNDGDADLYVLNFGANQLLRNDGDGTFTDVTAGSGTGDERWSIGASVADYDGDGRLDLYVVNYVRYEVENNVVCYATSSRRDYCGPDAFEPVADGLLRNVTPPGAAEPRFEDVSLATGIGKVAGPGLGVVAADFDDDGRLDYYVGNDGKPNFLWIQQRAADGTITFRDDSLIAGVAVSREGLPQASMGVDAGDFDGDGDEDLFMTHLTGETNTLYVNGGLGLFEDRTAAFGLGPASLAATSFGTSWIDVDNDGWLDLLVVNGAVKILESLARAGDPFPLDEANQLFRSVGGRRFEDATAAAGPAFEVAAVSRGAAFGDVDEDGDADVLVLNNNAAMQLLINRTGSERPWVGVRATGAVPGGAVRDQLGARVAVAGAAGGEQWRRIRTDGSFSSANDPRVVVGLGNGGRASAVRVLWPGGGETRWREPPAGRYLEIRRPSPIR